MTHWNYRVARRTFPETDEVEFGIYAVYYDDDENIEAWSARSFPRGSTLEELWKDLFRMSAALNKPVLEIEDSTDEPTEVGDDS